MDESAAAPGSLMVTVMHDCDQLPLRIDDLLAERTGLYVRHMAVRCWARPEADGRWSIRAWANLN